MVVYAAEYCKKAENRKLTLPIVSRICYGKAMEVSNKGVAAPLSLAVVLFFAVVLLLVITQINYSQNLGSHAQTPPEALFSQPPSAVLRNTDDLASLTEPKMNTTLSVQSTKLSWTPGKNAEGYWVWVGTGLGFANIVSTNEGKNTSATITIPLNGQPVYIRLFTKLNGTFANNYKDYMFQTRAIQ